MTMKKYFQLVQDGDTADLDIYGDIAEKWWADDGRTDSRSLSKQLEELGEVSQINVHINSYGGEVAEGLAIYNALRRHSAKIRTTCDGFACSIASVVFMAGDERAMSDASLLMIHDAWTSAYGANAADLRKLADDMDTITQASKNAYMSRVSIDEEKLSELMDAESWILPADAVDMGFATEIEDFGSTDAPSQCARAALVGMVRNEIAPARAAQQGEPVAASEPEPEPEPEPGQQAGQEPEPAPEPKQNRGAFKQSEGLLNFLQVVARREAKTDRE